ncbi:Fpg/Nei family DNA glycosylase [Nocardioides sp. B-3]|uniref:Fpg/Nei family DNA glycosylase n=1 Tax=Nocardioides sp. B-3 TaxID=2895565 RepID=UPI0021526243|nr:zinc finger domain-containing protein [Nocardioides sp. B-3]UUZ60042.1 Fpg/Nei family DNA glycosylase [Nocardioides sp. B-3]
MPEGHTLRRLADDLDAAFKGSLVRVGSPQGRFEADAAIIDGTRLLGADSAGKHLFVEFEHDHPVHVHLGLIGGFDVHTGVDEVPLPVGQVRLRIVRADLSAYGDLRGATQCELIGPTRRDEIVAGLGPDPLRAAADPDRARRRIKASHRPIGDLLMDQAVLAGVGNVYRAEVLFRNRIHPLRPGNTVRVSQWRTIWADLVDLMREGVINNRIDTVRPEHTPEAMGRDPRRDDHGGEVYVYRRTGQPCPVCGSPVRTEVLVGRNSFWCSQCQPRFRSRAVESSTASARGPRT